MIISNGQELRRFLLNLKTRLLRISVKIKARARIKRRGRRKRRNLARKRTRRIKRTKDRNSQMQITEMKLTKTIKTPYSVK